MKTDPFKRIAPKFLTRPITTAHLVQLVNLFELEAAIAWDEANKHGERTRPMREKKQVMFDHAQHLKDVQLGLAELLAVRNAKVIAKLEKAT